MTGGDRPTGTLTLFFSDMEGSTRLARALGDQWPDLLARHREQFIEIIDIEIADAPGADFSGAHQLLERGDDRSTVAQRAQQGGQFWTREQSFGSRVEQLQPAMRAQAVETF